MMMEAEARRPETEILVERLLDAPRELVWKVWSDPQHLAAWSGPEAFTTRVLEHDFRPGGQWLYVMTGPDGRDYPVLGTFQEIDPPARIVTTDDFDEGFEVPGVPELPRGLITTVLFEERGGKTALTARVSLPTLEDRRRLVEMGWLDGWHSSLDCLSAHLRAVQG